MFMISFQAVNEICWYQQILWKPLSFLLCDGHFTRHYLYYAEAVNSTHLTLHLLRSDLPANTIWAMSAKRIISDYTHSCSGLSWGTLIIWEEPVHWTLASLTPLSSDLRDTLDIRSELNRIWTACWVLAAANLPLLHFPWSPCYLSGWQPVSLCSCTAHTYNRLCCLNLSREALLFCSNILSQILASTDICQLNRTLSTVALYESHREQFEVKCNASRYEYGKWTFDYS